jgi:hypothetical protein
MRHIQPEYLNKKRVTFAQDNTWNLFQLVELSLHWLLLSRANVRFTQHYKVNYFSLTQFIEQTRNNRWKKEKRKRLQSLKPLKNKI